MATGGSYAATAVEETGEGGHGEAGEAGSDEAHCQVQAQTQDGASRRVQIEHSPNVRWQRSGLTREQRWSLLGQAGATVWFTGLPGAGKSTIAAAVEERLIADGRLAFLLDGDNLRHGLNGDLGFDEQARRENVRRTAHVAQLLAEAGTIALVSLVSPYAADRQAAAELHATADLSFIEVFVSTPLERCVERDPKGLYARARAGELKGLTGVGAPYEAPGAPDLVLHTCSESVQGEVERVLETLSLRPGFDAARAR